MNTDLVIAKIDAAKLALLEAKTIQDAKQIADVAEAARVYATTAPRPAKMSNFTPQRGVIRAERLLGDMLAVTEKAQGKRTDLVPGENQVEKPTLSDLGISKKLSSRAQNGSLGASARRRPVKWRGAGHPLPASFPYAGNDGTALSISLDAPRQDRFKPFQSCSASEHLSREFRSGIFPIGHDALEFAELILREVFLTAQAPGEHCDAIA